MYFFIPNGVPNNVSWLCRSNSNNEAFLPNRKVAIDIYFELLFRCSGQINKSKLFCCKPCFSDDVNGTILAYKNTISGCKTFYGDLDSMKPLSRSIIFVSLFVMHNLCWPCTGISLCIIGSAVWDPTDRN